MITGVNRKSFEVENRVMPLLTTIHARLSLLGLVLAAVAVLSAGCDNNRRKGVEGMVTLDGAPLADGYVKLLPQEGTAGPAAGAEIKDGRFSIDVTKGTFTGLFRVEITATRLSSRTNIDPDTGEKHSLREQYLPARYNTESQLTAQIKDDQANRLEFNLTSK